MKNTIILEMINNGEIEQLKSLLTEEIYRDNLKGNGNAKDRYSAMKRYFKYTNNNNPAFLYPCKDVNIDGKTYNSFCDGYCFALTTENIDTIETYDKTKGEYLNIEKIIPKNPINVEEIDLNIILAKAKSEGYKFSKAELGLDNKNDFKYIFSYKDGYFRIGLLDKAYSIIDDGKKSEVSYNGRLNMLLIKTSIGLAGVMPFNFNVITKENLNTKTIICIE